MEQIEECIRLAGDKAAVYSGDDSLTVPIMAMGGQGVISVASNVCPAFIGNMLKAFNEGNLAKASAMQRELLPLIRALFSEVNPIPVKYAAFLKGLCDGSLRLPLTPISDKNAAAVERELSLLTVYD